MTDGVISLLFGVGVAGFAYSRLARQTGNPNPRSSLIMAGVVGVIAFIVLYTLLKLVFNI